MLRNIDRMLDVEWLLLIIAILLFMLVLDMLFKRRTSNVLVEHHLENIEKTLKNTIRITSDINTNIHAMENRDNVRHRHYIEDRRKEGKLP